MAPNNTYLFVEGLEGSPTSGHLSMSTSSEIKNAHTIVISPNPIWPRAAS